MEKVILIRYGELFLKGKNKNYFEKALINNIKNSLLGLEYQFIKTQNRYYIESYDEMLQNEFISRLKKVFGLHSISLADKVDTDYDKLAEAVINRVNPNAKSFRISVNRADKRLDKTSTEIGALLGGKVLKAHNNIKVDLHNAEQEINVDIRERGYSYIFSDKIMCAQGMPCGTAGRGMLLLSGGFDSPVAGYRMARRGMEIYAIHFYSYPHTSEQAKQKVIDIAGVMSDYCSKIKLFCVPFTPIQEAIHQYCRPDYMITIMRRIMMDIAQQVALNNNCGALITGESLAQVASQTTESILVTNNVVNALPMFRPLIGMDKNEIIDTAKEIGTYELSELPFEDCCTVFLPKHPVIKPLLKTAINEQSRIVDLQKLIENAIQNIEIKDIKRSL